jgi:dTDP-4-amino-4,6-dideoxygalactose transaminase
MPVLLPRHADRDAVGLAMQEAGIQTTIHYPPVHTLSFYRSREPELRLPLTEEFHRRELTLPLHPAMTDADVDRVVESLEGALVASRERAA